MFGTINSAQSNKHVVYGMGLTSLLPSLLLVVFHLTRATDDGFAYGHRARSREAGKRGKRCRPWSLAGCCVYQPCSVVMATGQMKQWSLSGAALCWSLLPAACFHACTACAHRKSSCRDSPSPRHTPLPAASFDLSSSSRDASVRIRPSQRIWHCFLSLRRSVVNCFFHKTQTLRWCEIYYYHLRSGKYICYVLHEIDVQQAVEKIVYSIVT